MRGIIRSVNSSHHSSIYFKYSVLTKLGRTKISLGRFANSRIVRKNQKISKNIIRLNCFDQLLWREQLVNGFSLRNSSTAFRITLKKREKFWNK
jgi:hypothetical protein